MARGSSQRADGPASQASSVVSMRSSPVSTASKRYNSVRVRLSLSGSMGGDPSVSYEGAHARGQLLGPERALGDKAGEIVGGETGDEAVVGAEPRSQAADHLDLVLGGSSTAQIALA